MSVEERLLHSDWFEEGHLVLPPGLSFEEWADIGEALHAMERNVQWWLGDWWRYGERNYGEAAAQAAPTGFALQTVKNCAWVADRVEPSRRRDDLPFAYHEAVAALEPEAADELLEAAADHQWNRFQLRSRVRQAQGRDATMAECTCASCGNLHYRKLEP